MLTKSEFCTIVFTASSFFLLGCYYQYSDALKNLLEIVQNDPYAFYIRYKLFDIFRVFKFNGDELLLRSQPTRMQEIMKYGYPGLDDVRLYSDFVLSYDRRNRVAHWVYEHLTAKSVKGSEEGGVSRRTAQFKPDFNVPSNFRTDLKDYNKSGFDRGHLAAAGNHKAHQTHCNETFFLTNIAPQVGKGFNRDAWNNLEMYVRNLAEHYGSVYVCTGPLYKPRRQPGTDKLSVEYQVIGPHTVAVPTHFFKVITIESKTSGLAPYMEAYVMPNEPMPNNVDIRQFLCDIKELERIAGLQFFNGLRQSYFFGVNYETTPELFQRFL